MANLIELRAIKCIGPKIIGEMINFGLELNDLNLGKTMKSVYLSAESFCE